MFREDKTTQAAVRFLTLADGRLPYFTLMKLLYLADTEMLVKRGTLTTFDQWYISPLGPMLGATLNLIRSKNAPPSYWNRFIDTEGFDVVLKADPGDDDLSNAEDAIIERTFNELWGEGKWDALDGHPDFQN